MANDNSKTLSLSSSDTVTIACKLPHGLVLQLAKPATTQEAVMGGGTREVKVFHRQPEQVTVFGNAHAQNVAPEYRIIGGYALTEDVNAAFWAAWLEQNKSHPAVRNDMIFAMPKNGDAVAKAKELKDKRSGLERLDPNKLPKGLERGTPAKATETV